MHNNESGTGHTPRQPMGAAKHFWLSFLAVVTGVPVSMFILFSGAFLGLLVLIIMIAATVPDTSSGVLPMSLTYGKESSPNKIVAVPVRGIILSGTAADPLQTLFGQSYADGEQIKEQLRLLAEDSTVDGVIIEIDSPGGMINASKAIADGISYFKQATNKPVYSHINGSGASGAYWVASSTDKIYAEQGSEAGSIGVIMGPLVTMKDVVSYGGVTTTSPMKFKYYSAGKSKDLGNPFREITTEEEAFINQQLTAEYDKFVSHVAKARTIEAADIKNTIGALAYGTDEAIRLGLIDGMMSKEDAYATIAKEAGVEMDYKVLRLDNSEDVFGSLFGVRNLLQSMKMSESDKSAARNRFCETNLSEKPLVFSGDISAVCR